jgi:hypothetical protein
MTRSADSENFLHRWVENEADPRQSFSMDDLKSVTSDEMLMEQVEQALRMTPEERFRAGGQLFDATCRFSLAGIRSNFPLATEAEIQSRLQNRLEIARMIDGRVPA